jgi:AraC-like DNA-binding protein
LIREFRDLLQVTPSTFRKSEPQTGGNRLRTR